MVTTRSWSNWDGRQQCAPSRVLVPRGEAELCEQVAAAAADGLTLRPVGSGHSFTDLCVTGDAQIDLSAQQGVIDADPASGLVRVHAGTPLHRLAAELHEYGLALENQGDIDRQTIAGALSTATHGTGLGFRNLAANVTGCRLVTADGAVHELGAGDRRLPAARTSLGALGVLSELTLRAVPAFRLRKREAPAPLDQVLADFPALVREHDHFEFYAFPYADRVLTMASERTDAPPAPRPPWKRWVVDELVANVGLAAFSRAGRRLPQRAPQLARAMSRLISADERTDHSHRVFSSQRRVRFTEMEYALPLERVPGLVQEVLDLIRRERIGVTFPIEVRAVAADDAWLSTAHGRATGYIAVHQFEGMPYAGYFAAVEALLAGAGGRPHWGKRHTQVAATLAPRYPRWDDFQAVRAALDPTGAFTNPALERVLGPAGAGVGRGR